MYITLNFLYFESLKRNYSEDKQFSHSRKDFAVDCHLVGKHNPQCKKEGNGQLLSACCALGTFPVYRLI